MKQNRFKRLCGVALGLIMLAALPFAVFAQSETKPADPEEVIITLEGVFGGKGIFVFEGNTIQYRKENGNDPNTLKVNGISWKDVNVPFELDFTPDFEQATIVERSKQFYKEIDSSLNARKNGFELSVNNLFGGRGSYYIVKIAAKNQKAKMNPISPDAIESTNGMNHQDVRVNTSYIVPPDYLHGDRVFIKGAVDRITGFRIRKAQVCYLVFDAAPSGYSGGGGITFDGKFASDVTVNGKEWSNLSKPFELSFPVTLSSYRRMNFKAENCNISYSVNGDMIEVIIQNNNKKTVPFEVQLFFKDLEKNAFHESSMNGIRTR